MSDPVELLLRDVLTERAAATPDDGGDLGRGARRRLRRRRLARAGAALAVVGLVAGGVAVVPRDEPATVVAAGPDVPLVGTDWRLVSYLRSGRSALPETATVLFGLSPEGTFAGEACNYLGGRYTTDGPRLVVRLGLVTQKSCGADGDRLQDDFTSFVEAGVDWDVTGDRLRLTGADGDHFVFRADPIAGQEDAETLDRGVKDGWEYHFGFSDYVGLFVETRSGPGNSWHYEGGKDEPEYPMTSVFRMPVGRRGAQFVAGYATPDTAYVRHEVPGGARTTLRLYRAGKRIVFGGFVPRNPKGSRVRAYRADGTMIAGFRENRPDG